MQKARTCGCIPLVASHWFRPISRIPLIAFHRLRSSGSLQRLTPKDHPERRISSFQELHSMKRTSSRIATSCPSMEILKPGPRHPRNPPFAPQSSKYMLIAGGSITIAFSLQEALQYLCRSKEQPRIAGRTRATSESSNSNHLRAFSIGNWHAKRLICSILFECSVHVIYRILLEPLRMNRPRTNAPEAIEPRVIPLPQ